MSGTEGIPAVHGGEDVKVYLGNSPQPEPITWGDSGQPAAAPDPAAVGRRLRRAS